MAVESPEVPGAPPAIPDVLPVLPLRGGVVILPSAVIPLVVGQERSVRLIDEVMHRDRLLALVAPRAGAPDPPGPEDLHPVGTAAMVHQLVRTADGTLRVVIQGVERVRLLDYV